LGKGGIRKYGRPRGTFDPITMQGRFKYKYLLLKEYAHNGGYLRKDEKGVIVS
jgi:hypothetical protein